MPVKQRLDITDLSDLPSFLAKKMNYEFQERRLKNNIDIFIFNSEKCLPKRNTVLGVHLCALYSKLSFRKNC